VTWSGPRDLARLAAIVLIAFGLTIGPAGAEQTGRDGLVVFFKAQISPHLLPRKKTMPVTVALSGGIRADRRKGAPRLRSIELAFASLGKLDVTGLPTCPRSRLRDATRKQALSRCRPALVGRGSVLTELPLAPEQPLLAKVSALAFNARRGGRPAVWLYAYSARPPVSFVLPFTVREVRNNAYGLQLTAPVGRILGRWPRLRSFGITLGRRYRSNGKRHSYVSARCPLPPRLHGLTVPAALATYYFAAGPTIRQPISRACQARD
jgi:hypothetical protein